MRKKKALENATVFDNTQDAEFLLREYRKQGFPAVIFKEQTTSSDSHSIIVNVDYIVEQDKRFEDRATKELFIKGSIVYEGDTGIPYEIEDISYRDFLYGRYVAVNVTLTNLETSEKEEYSPYALRDCFTYDLKKFKRQKLRRKIWEKFKDVGIAFIAVSAFVTIFILMVIMTIGTPPPPLGTVSYQSGSFVANVENAEVKNTLLADGSTQSEYHIVLKCEDGAAKSFVVDKELFEKVGNFDRVTVHYTQAAYDADGNYIPDGGKVYKGTTYKTTYDINGTEITALG